MKWLAPVVVLVGVLLWFSGQVGLAEDEAYYWVWSRSLAAGYYDHPPAIAWLIRLGTAVLGDTERGVRLAPILLGGGTLALVGSASRNKLLAVLLLGSMPLFMLGGLLATPDIPLVFAWALGLWAANRERWAVVGLAAGLAMLSKYTGVMLLPLLVLARPSDLRTRGPWIAAAVAFVVYLPNAWWNVSHDLVSWRFQLSHVAEEARRLEFLGAQAGLAGPLSFLAVAAWWMVGWRRSPDGEANLAERRAWWVSLPLLLVGVIAGGEANWAAPAYIGAAVGIASRGAPLRGAGGVTAGSRIARAAWIGSGVSAALSAVVLAHALHPLIQLPDDPTHRLMGGRVLGDSVAAWGVEDVYASRYQEAALIHFYGGVPARTWPGIGRRSHYDLQPFTPPESGLFVRVWQGGRSLLIEDRGYERSGPNVVTAYANTTDPTAWQPVARWQIYQFERNFERIFERAEASP